MSASGLSSQAGGRVLHRLVSRLRDGCVTRRRAAARGCTVTGGRDRGRQRRRSDRSDLAVVSGSSVPLVVDDASQPSLHRLTRRLPWDYPRYGLDPSGVRVVEAVQAACRSILLCARQAQRPGPPTPMHGSSTAECSRTLGSMSSTAVTGNRPVANVGYQTHDAVRSTLGNKQ
jgi:hypothetical protein